MLWFGRVGAGFMKEQLRVSTEERNTIRVRGERLLGGNKWSRFLEDFEVPENSDMNSVKAKFHEGALTITIPKKIVDKPRAPTPEKAKKETPKGSETQHTSGQAAEKHDKRSTPPSKDGMSKESTSSEEKHRGKDGAAGAYEKEKKSDETPGKIKLKPDDGAQTEEKGRGADEGAFTKKAVKGIGQLNEERQLVVNMGVAVLVIVSLAAFVTYKFVSADNKK